MFALFVQCRMELPIIILSYKIVDRRTTLTSIIHRSKELSMSVEMVQTERLFVVFMQMIVNFDQLNQN